METAAHIACMPGLDGAVDAGDGRAVCICRLYLGAAVGCSSCRASMDLIPPSNECGTPSANAFARARCAFLPMIVFFASMLFAFIVFSPRHCRDSNWILLMTADVYRLSEQATYLESAVHALLRVPTPFPHYILLARSGIDFKVCPAARIRVARAVFYVTAGLWISRRVKQPRAVSSFIVLCTIVATCARPV
jgi:hypothetical protein